MPVKDRDPFVAVAATLNILVHPDYRSSYLEIYFSLCSRAGTNPAKANFCTCFPGIEKIAEKFGHSRMTVIDGTRWLEVESYVFKQKRHLMSNLYTIIIRRDWFRQIRQAEGFEVAKERYKGWLNEVRAGTVRNRTVDSSGSDLVPPGGQRSSRKDSGVDRNSFEVPVTGTSRTTCQKSSPLHLELDPAKTITKGNRSEDLERDLPLGPFIGRTPFD